ncbi:MAG TPA: hypothetical protein VFE19_00285 [Jatrophihabitantaceae bacterium]|nr:hypothetical protein [Jatrophihabitantaceae bacterium]
MTAPSEVDAVDATRLGREAAARLRLPGPPRARSRPSRIGSIASSSARFAAGTARPIAVRRALAGPDVVPVRSYRNAGVAPPRWWTPEAEAPREVATRRSFTPAELPARGLPRAVRRVPDQQTWTPGGIVAGLHAEVANVRRMDATTAAGPMLMAHDRARLAPSKRAAAVARSGAPPTGQPSGGGTGPGATTSAPTASGNAQPTPSPSALLASPAVPGRPSAAISRFLAAVRRTLAPPAATTAAAGTPRAVAAPAPAAVGSEPAPGRPMAASPSTRRAATRSAAGPGGQPASGPVADEAPYGPAALAAPTAATSPRAGEPSPAAASAAPTEPAAPGPLRRTTTAITATTGHAPLGIVPASGALRPALAPAPVRPLRRMLGPAHALRPAARTGTAATRPAALPVATPAASAGQAESGATVTPLRRSPDVVSTRSYPAAAKAPASTARPASAGASSAADDAPPAVIGSVPAEQTQPGSQPASTPAAATGATTTGTVLRRSPPAADQPQAQRAGADLAVAAARPAAAAASSRWTPGPARGVALASVRPFGHRRRGSGDEIRPALAIHRLAATGASRAPALPSLPAAGAAAEIRRAPGAAAASRASAAVAASGTATAGTASGTASGTATTGAAAQAASQSGTRAGASARGSATAASANSAPATAAASPLRAPAGASASDQHAHTLSCAPGCAAAPSTGAAVRRLASVSMPDLISTARRPAAGSTSRPGLASGFGPSAAIVAAGSTMSTSSPAAIGGSGPVPPRPTVRRSVAVAAHPRAAATSAATRPLAGHGQSPATIHRSYLPAPPPISIRPAPLSGAPVPAAARGPLPDQTPAAVRRSTDLATTGRRDPAGSATPRSALADATADLFRSARVADAPIRRLAAGSAGGTNVQDPPDHLPVHAGSAVSPAVLNAPPHQAAPVAGQAPSAELRPHQLDEIVERVIDKIEQRVVDELERRGRRFNPGVF